MFSWAGTGDAVERAEVDYMTEQHTQDILEAVPSTKLTLYAVLREYLDILEGQLRSFSHNSTYHTPKQGWEKPYEETWEKIQMIKAEMRRVRYGQQV